MVTPGGRATQVTTVFAVWVPTFVVVTVSLTGTPDSSVAVFGVISTRSIVGASPRGTDAVAALLAVLESVTLGGSVTLAVFEIVAGAPAFGMPATVKTTWPPAAMSTGW